MDANVVDDYGQQIKTILLTNPATGAALNTALLAYDTGLANKRLQTALKNVTQTLLLNNTDSTLVNDALGLL